MAALVAAVLIGTAAAWWWSSPDNRVSTRSSDQALMASASKPERASVGIDSTDNHAASATGAAGGLKPGANSDSFLTPDLRQKLETMILEATTGADIASPAALKKQLAGSISTYFPPELVARALALAERYVDYRAALGDIKPPVDPGNPRALRDALDARQRVREQYFTGEEADALFSADSQLDRYTLARLEIERNQSLTAAQKAAALQDAEQLLSPAERAQRDAAMSQLDVQAQTQAFDNSRASDAERFAQRQAMYGNAAAAQLAKLDRENENWKARLDSYAAAQSGSSPEQLQALRQQLFTTEEQLRVEAALAARSIRSQPR